MLVRAPPVEAKQDGSVRIQDLTKVVMARSRLGLAEERLVPFEAVANVAYADDRPCAFHCISAVGLHFPNDHCCWVPENIKDTFIRPNEKEINHGRVSWRTRRTYLAEGPLASSIG